jgi:hypothetical protein
VARIFKKKNEICGDYLSLLGWITFWFSLELFDWDLKKRKCGKSETMFRSAIRNKDKKEKKMFTGLFTRTEQRSITCYISNAVWRVVLATFYLHSR